MGLVVVERFLELAFSEVFPGGVGRAVRAGAALFGRLGPSGFIGEFGLAGASEEIFPRLLTTAVALG